MMPQCPSSRHLGTSHSSPSHHQLPCHIFLNLIDSLKVILVLGKVRSHRAPRLDCRGAESPGWFGWLFHQKIYIRLDAWVGTLFWLRCQSPVAHSCGLLNHLNNFHRGMFKLNAKCDADSLLYSVILNVTVTQYTCSLNGIYWQVQWSHHCSCMHIPAHCLWLPGYISVMQTILVILKMAGFFPDRTLFVYEYIFIYLHICIYFMYLYMYIFLCIYIYIQSSLKFLIIGFRKRRRKRERNPHSLQPGIEPAT